MKILKSRTRTRYCSICGLEIVKNAEGHLEHTPESDNAIERLDYPGHDAASDRRPGK